MIFFHPMNGDVLHFPKPQLPLLPLPGLCYKGKGSPVNGLRDLRDFGAWCFTNSGRGAIYHALEGLKLTPRQRVLVPSYHCASLVAPVLEKGLEAVFYNVRNDLQPDLEDIERKIEDAKCLILVHYFGFHQDTTGKLAQLCQDANVSVIEDCAHCYYSGGGERTAVGKLGHYMIGSTRKFVSGLDGGILVSSSQQPKLSLTNRGLKEELRSFVNLYEWANHFDGGGKIGHILKRISRLRRNVKHTDNEGMTESSDCVVTEHKTSDTPNDWLRREDRDWDISRVSRSQVIRANGECIASRRRELFSKYLAQLKGLTAQPLFGELPHDVVPYVFPLLLDNPTRDFAPLKQAALPLYRWEEMAVTDCAVADDYRQRLVQLPCHQSLSDYEVAWMINKLRELL